MKTPFIRKSAVVAAALGTLGGAPVAALASSHREAPAISNDPVADNTDLYAWVTPGTHDKLYVLANYIPLEEPAGGPNFNEFSDEVRYEIHLADTSHPGLRDLVTYYVFFNTANGPRVDPGNLDAPPGGGKEFFRQLSGRATTYRVVRVNAQGRATELGHGLTAAPPNIGPRTQAVAFGGRPYDDAFAAQYIHPLGNGGAEGRVFAGPRDDGFYVDLAGIFDLANLHGPGQAPDGVSGYNVHTIALEIPKAGLGDVQQVGVWAAASRRKVTVRMNRGYNSNYGPWVQVSRLGLPLINEAVIGLQDKDYWNATPPSADVPVFGAYFLNPVIVRDAEAVGIYQALGVPQDTVNQLKSNRLDILAAVSLMPADQVGQNLNKIGDVLRVNLDEDSGFPNGRSIPGAAHPNQEQTDVTDTILTVALSGGALTVSDNVNYNDVNFLDTFPFLALPHAGYDSPHAAPQPPLAEP